MSVTVIDEVEVTILPCGEKGEKICCASNCPEGYGKNEDLTNPFNSIEKCYNKKKKEIEKG